MIDEYNKPMKAARLIVLVCMSPFLAMASNTEVRWSTANLEERGIIVSIVRSSSELHGEIVEVSAFIDKSERNATIRFVDFFIDSPCGAVSAELSLDEREDGWRVRGPRLSRGLLSCSELAFVDTFGLETTASVTYRVSLEAVLESLEAKEGRNDKIEKEGDEAKAVP